MKFLSKALKFILLLILLLILLAVLTALSWYEGWPLFTGAAALLGLAALCLAAMTLSAFAGYKTGDNLVKNGGFELDVDRQDVTVRGTPREIDELIRQEVSRLGSREGGLMLIYGLYPGTPIENAAAVMDAMERYAGFFS